MRRPRVKVPTLAEARDLAGIQAALAPFHATDTVVLEQVRRELVRASDARLAPVIQQIDVELDWRTAA